MEHLNGRQTRLESPGGLYCRHDDAAQSAMTRNYRGLPSLR